MRYIPGSVVIKPNQASLRLLPQLNTKLIYILQNIRPIRVVENEKEIKKLKYTFTEVQSPNDYTIKDPSQFHSVDIMFDDYAKADAVLNRILGVQDTTITDTNEYDPEPNETNRAEVRRKLNDVANRQFNRRR